MAVWSSRDKGAQQLLVCACAGEKEVADPMMRREGKGECRLLLWKE
jgi:hypothetical protein